MELTNVYLRPRNHEVFPRLRQNPFSDSTCIRMLSNITPNFNPGRQQRQNSTPNIFDDHQTRLDATNPQHVSHRRGLSLDQSAYMQPIRTLNLQQEDASDLASRGFENYQRHLLQEAQKQQQQLARPGQEGLGSQTNEQESQTNIESTPYLGYGNYAFTNDPFISSTPNLNDNNIPTSLDPNLTEIFYGQTPLITNEVAEYLEGLQEVHHENVAGTMLCEGETNMNSNPGGNGTVDFNTLRPSSRGGPMRPCTPQNQNNSCKF